MSISVADNFSYQGAKPLDARFQFSSVANMKAAAEATLYNGCFAYVTATKKYYSYDSSNSVDATLGKWREYSSGGGDDENAYHITDTAETALADADYFPFYDTSASAKRKTLWSNVKSVLKTYFDTLYSTTKTRGTATSGGTTLSLVNTGDMYNWNTDSVIYCTSSTSASTAAKVATVSRGTFTLVAGAKVCVKFTYSNTASAPTLNVASTGAKNIKYIGTDGVVETPNVWWGAGDIVTFIYDGTQFLMQLTYAMPSMPILGTIDRSDIYDGNEKVIGKWYDGRPIYQKSIIYLMPTISTDGTRVVGSFVSVGASINLVVDIQATVSSGNAAYDILNSVDYKSRYTRVVVTTNSASSNKNSVAIVSSDTSFSNETAVITLRYTKTTDAANSYNYADENDYSTSEKIVGTWVDGKKIYKRTFQTTLPDASEDPTTNIVTVGTSYISIGANLDWCVDTEMSIKSPSGACTNALPYVTTTQVYQVTALNTWQQPINIPQTRVTIFTNSAPSNKNTIRLENRQVGHNGATCYITIKYTKV